MNYANTYIRGGVETVAVVLPLSAVPGFDPENPPQANTYGVPDDVQVGWEKQPDGSFAPHVPTTAEIVAQYERALDAHLDSVAKQYRYDNRFTFALRAGYPGPYHDEAVAFAAWMDTCNVQAFTLLSEVQAGNATMPTIEGFIAGLPVFVL